MPAESEMHQILIDHFNGYSAVPLAPAEEKFVRSKFIPKTIRKRQYLLQKGQVSRQLTFVVSGSMRQYTVDEKGAEHIVRLSIENWWAGDHESFFMSKPSLYNVDAWEESKVLVIAYSDFQKSMENPAFATLARKLDQEAVILTQERIHSLISLTAAQRYKRLVKENPEFIQRFPQYLIASYLGMTKETLSRLRKKP